MLDQMQSYMGTFFSKDYVWKKVLRFNDQEVDKMQAQIRKETEMDIEDGGIDMPDAGDGITRYPADREGKLIPPEDMPDYEDPSQDGIPADDDEKDEPEPAEPEDIESDKSFIVRN